MDEGYIKFSCDWEEKKVTMPEDLDDVNRWLEMLKSENLIGVYEDGIGFGNLSIRFDSNKFVITGTQTGAKEILEESDYAIVDSYDIVNNSISCSGLTKASSESLTHAAIYEIAPEVNAVVHIHSKYLWEKYLNVFPTVVDAQYGTPEMALSIQQIIKNEEPVERTIIMAEHEEGILVYAKSLKEACLKILSLNI